MKILAFLCAAAIVLCVRGDDCLYTSYSNFVNANERYMVVSYEGDSVNVTIQSYAVAEIQFGPTINDICAYSTDDTNGWTVSSVTDYASDTCAMVLTKTFTTDDYQTYCAVIADTSTGYQLTTQVAETSQPLYTGTSLDGTKEYTTMNTLFNDVLYLPSSATASLTFYVNAPPEYTVLLSGSAGVLGTNDYANIKAQMNAPYYIYAINPVPKAIPQDQYGAVVLVNQITQVLHSYSTILALITSVPIADCKCSGTFTLEFLVTCSGSDPACDQDILDQYPSFTADISLVIPDCATTTQTAEASLTIITYDGTGDVDLSFTPGDDVVVEEIITLTQADLTPENNCICVTDFIVKDWSGTVIEEYPDVENDADFNPVSLGNGPKYNKFQITLPSSVLTNDNGNVIDIEATCTLEWINVTTVKKISVRTADSAAGNLGLNVAAGSGSDDDDSWVWIVVGCVCGCAALAAVAAVVVAFVVIKKKSAENTSLLQYS